MKNSKQPVSLGASSPPLLHPITQRAKNICKRKNSSRDAINRLLVARFSDTGGSPSLLILRGSLTIASHVTAGVVTAAERLPSVK